MVASQKDGVIKLKQDFTKGSPPNFNSLRETNRWRRIFYEKGIIGQYPPWKGGVGYGNVSQRLNRNSKSIDNRFVITGSQTGNLPRLGPEHYTTVLECYPLENRAVVKGPIKASSESMTHYQIYRLDQSANFVFHTHSSDIWNNSRRLIIPTTREDAEYGTPEMAGEVERLWKETNIEELKILSMGGHDEGVITWGKTAAEAGMRMMIYYQIGRGISLSQKIMRGKPGGEVGGRVINMFVERTISGYRTIKRRISS